MAQNASNDIRYFLVLEKSRKDDLAAIRQWNNLKVAFEGDYLWIKDFNFAQIHSSEVKSMPFKTIYDCKQGKLYFTGSLLPERNVPNLLWTNVDRALPVKLPPFNHNYFGISEQISMQLIPSEIEHSAVSMLLELSDLTHYIETAAAVRLQHIQWAILNNDKAFIIGTPLLPIKAQVYWQDGQFMIPAGYNFELPFLNKQLGKLIDPENRHWIIWSTDSTYALLERNDLQPLTLGSYRLNTIRHSLQIR